MMNIEKLTFDEAGDYATEANADKAVNNWIKRGGRTTGNKNLPTVHYVVIRNSHGRYVPVFVGQRALDHCIHFSFCVVS